MVAAWAHPLLIRAGPPVQALLRQMWHSHRNKLWVMQGQAGEPEKGTSLFMGGGSPNGGSNNYSRPSGQNVGNFLTDRNSSRVLAPPGGASQISFG